jgi:xanthine dehydrogenase small subunit
VKINFILNDKAIEIDADPKARIIDILREDRGLTGTKEGCGAGDCGACTILVNGVSRLACLMLASQLEGRSITTIEGLTENGIMNPLQEEFITQGAVQCGFCTPGMVMAAHALLARSPRPDRAEIQEAISGNLCRCTGYQKIVEAIEEAAQRIDTREQATGQGISQDTGTGKTECFASVHRLREIPSNRFFLPKTLEEVWRIIEEQPDIILYAGGTDILVKLRISHTLNDVSLLCLERIGELRTLYESAGRVFIGACCTHSQLLLNPLIQQRFPVLMKALKSLGSPPIRNMGTIGGNICTASPAGDTLPPLYVLDGQVEIRSKGYSRRMPIKDFIVGPGKTALKMDEMLYGIWLEDNNEYNVHHFEKVGQRRSLAISIASLAALARTTKSGIVERAMFAWGSVGPTVVRSEDAETAIIGKPLSEDTLKALVPIVEKTLSPIDDIRASAAYRRIVAGNLLFRLIE